MNRKAAFAAPWSRRQLFTRLAPAITIATRLGYTTPSAAAPASRNQLAEKFPLEELARRLVPRSSWKPFPPAADRRAWTRLAAELRHALSRQAEEALAIEWPPLPASYFLDFARTGDRQKADTARQTRRNILRRLVLGECVEYRARFLDPILNAVWSICEETYWGSPAHLNMQRAGAGLPDVTEPTVDLFAADTAALLAWCDYLLGPELDRLSPLVRQRIQFEVNRRVLTPCLERTDFWWMGLGQRQQLNNWTPWICSNWLAANLLLETDPKRRVQAVAKALGCLDRFLAGYHDDGGCDEGPGYWNRAAGSLFDCLELLHWATGGTIQVYDQPLIAEMGRYIVRVHIHNDYYVNFADASAIQRVQGGLLYRYGSRVQDENLKLLGAWAAHRYDDFGGIDADFHRALPVIFGWTELSRAPGRQPLLPFAWMSGIEVMTARQRAGDPRGLFVAAKGGHNAESHNHNDVGNFIVYLDGLPAVIDVGVGTYTAKTFSPQRYEIWTMQSAWHNLPTVNGIMQAPGRQYAARNARCVDDGQEVRFELDLAAAYPSEAGARRWLRQLVLDRRAGTVILTDEFELGAPARELTQSLISAHPVQQLASGILHLQGPSGPSGPLVIRYPHDQLSVRIEEKLVEDPRLERVWGPRVYRILLVLRESQQAGRWQLEFSPARAA